MPFAPGDRKPSVSCPHTPRQNYLLSVLPLPDYERLLPYLELVPLPLGSTIHGACEREKHMYFPISGSVSRGCSTQNGGLLQCAVTGKEGAIGVSLFLGGESSTCAAVVASVGYAYRLRADLLKKEVEINGPLQHLLLRYTLILMEHAAQIATCTRYHSVEQQLCRVILGCLDLSLSKELTMTHEQISNMLGVRREGVTEAAGRLQEAGLIHYSRGSIAVLDRSKLEARACECYAVIKRGYVRFFQKFGDPESLQSERDNPIESFVAPGQEPLIC